MAFKIRKSPKAYERHLRLVEQGDLMQDDGAPKPEFEQIPITFLCPPGFEPAAFLITALDKEGRSFTNAPTDQPELSLRLATVAMDFASQHAIVHIQAEKMKSPIVHAPAGSVPTWPGPEGRG